MRLQHGPQTLHLGLVARYHRAVGLLAVGALVEDEEPDQLTLVGAQSGYLPGEPLVDGGAFFNGVAGEFAAGVVLR
jgi:N-acetylneuraminic acid mutarotase